VNASIQQLVHLAQAGNSAATEELFRRAARLAHARAARLLPGADEAADVAQEALVAAYRSLPRLRDERAFVGWLRRIVDRSVVRGARRAAGCGVALPGEAAATEPSPQAAIESADAEAAVARALASLPPRSRLVMELFYFDGLTCREVAEFLEVSTDSVKASLHRSRERLRGGIRTMAEAAPAGYRKWYMMVSGDATFAGPLFEHDSDVSRLYTAMYPAGSPVRAAKVAGVAEGRVPELVEFLARRGLVTGDGPALRCAMPILSDVDLEVLRPWISRTAGIVIDALDGLEVEAKSIAGGLTDPAARDTALAVALYADPITRPLSTVAEAMDAAAPDRGEFGRFTAAISVAEETPLGFDGGFSSDWVQTPHGPCYTIYLHPNGCERSGVERLLGHHPELANRDAPGARLASLLVSLEANPPTASELGALLAACGIGGDPEALAADLVAAGGARWHDGRLHCAVAMDRIARWGPYWARLDALGQSVADRLGDGAADLRQRIARCSFAECSFADAVTACVMLVRATIGAEVRSRQWVQVPAAADLSWGYMLVW